MFWFFFATITKSFWRREINNLFKRLTCYQNFMNISLNELSFLSSLNDSMFVFPIYNKVEVNKNEMIFFFYNLFYKNPLKN